MSNSNIFSVKMKYEYTKYILKKHYSSFTFKILNDVLIREELSTISWSTYKKIRKQLEIRTRNTNKYSTFDISNVISFKNWIQIKGLLKNEEK